MGAKSPASPRGWEGKGLLRVGTELLPNAALLLELAPCPWRGAAKRTLPHWTDVDTSLF